MSDSTTAPKPETTDSEPPSTTAPAPARGQSLITRLKALFAFRTPSLRDDLEVALESEAAGETADFSPSERAILQNVLSLGDRVTAFLDPSACYGDPELELAYVDAWQSFGQAFWDAYTAVRPIDAGFQRVRRHVYALYPLLMHVYYFGDRFLPKLSETLAAIRLHM